MKLEKKWYSAARGTLLGAFLLLGAAGGVRGGAGPVFLALGAAAAAVFAVIEMRHLRCPNCGRPVFPWLPMEENRHCRTCGFAFSWQADRWWEKAD